ncbi:MULTISPECIES: SpaH/EbpB family LPXTG-anchored major pilin [unclassified Leucobacter]|uniref:SpaH/EbpB family LPXTG-anchored major pilin n=1 Tax=unclassified Leucobacter TaxID=2621730 RepID=UPI00165E69DD|nr:SpaH/EbpB family LPXTG-anchored major pilin [Leucobacter sp. CX169]MBC9926594.1 prealbumin-like fold domain-containing protein [Leucobacter sp. cx-169]
MKIDGVDVPFSTGGSGNTLDAIVDITAVNNSIESEIVVVFTGVVETLGDGVIRNTATLFVNDPTKAGTGIPSNTVATHWGDLVISKVDADSVTTGLAGAKFEVYESNDPYAADCAATTPGVGPISVDGETEFATAAGGLVTVPGLYVTDSGNMPNELAAARCYFIKETAAPTGFVLPSGGAEFTAVEVVTGASATADVVIENTKQSVPSLPLTGGAGQAALVIGGLALIGGGIGVASIRRRKLSA